MNKIKCNINVEVETSFSDSESNEDTVAYVIEEDLKDNGWKNIKATVNNICKLNTKDNDILLSVLKYFKDGLEDIESGSNEKQPMQDEVTYLYNKLK